MGLEDSFMKMSKWISTGLMVFLALSLVLTGCGSQSSSQQTGQDASSGGGSDTGDSGVPTVNVGYVGVMTGGGADIGLRVKQGSDLAIKDINAEGKVKLNVSFEDSQAKNDLAVNAINRLIDIKKVPIVVGLWTGPNLSMAPISEKNKVLQLNPAAQGDKLAGANPYLFNTLPTLKVEESKLAEYLVKEKGAKSAAIFYQNDATGKPAMEDFQEGFKKAGGQIVGNEAVSIDQTDFRTSISKVLAKKPDTLFIATTGGLLPLMQQIHQAGYDGIVAGNSWVTAPELANSDLSKGILHTQVAYNPPEDVNKRYEAEYGEKMDFWAHQGYDVMVFIKNLVLGMTEKGLDITGDNARQFILDQKEFDGLSSKIVFDPETNTAEVNVEIRELQGNGGDKVITTIQAGQ
jgi:branched-chain amino acid transport system substrate-binding protein